MKLALFLMLCLAACTQQQITAGLKSPDGQLFCAVQTGGGGAIIVGLIDASAAMAPPPSGPVAIIATGAAKQVVDAECAQAGGVAVSPPVNRNVPMRAVKAVHAPLSPPT